MLSHVAPALWKTAHTHAVRRLRHGTSCSLSSSATSMSSPSSSQEVHNNQSRPVFPSVLRLLEENSISDVGDIKGTGIRGMLTKGDVLAYLGKATSPTGTYKDNIPTPSIYKSQAVISGGAPAPKKPLDPAEIRHVILSALLASSIKSRTPAPSPAWPTVDSVIADYLPRSAANRTLQLST